MSFEDKLTELGITLPDPPKPEGTSLPAMRVGSYVYATGHLPLAGGEVKFQGKLGREVPLEEGYEAAKISTINCLAAIKSVLGSLDSVEQVVKVVGYVNSAPGFVEQPKVVSGASDLVDKVFGSAGEAACSAVGVAELPVNSAVQVELIVKVKQ